MGARADGWWRDRAAAASRLCREVIALARGGYGGYGGSAPREISPGLAPDTMAGSAIGQTRRGSSPADAWVLVLEGRARDAMPLLEEEDPSLAADWAPAEGEGPAPVRLVSAAGSGDDAIVGVVAEVVARAESCLVVTADRRLRQRCEERGASVVGPGWLLRLL